MNAAPASLSSSIDGAGSIASPQGDYRKLSDSSSIRWVLIILLLTNGGAAAAAAFLNDNHRHHLRRSGKWCADHGCRGKNFIDPRCRNYHPVRTKHCYHRLWFRPRDEDVLREKSRWVGKTKSSIHHLWEIPKSKKHIIELKRNSNDSEPTIFAKQRGESIQHVLTKAFLWKLFSDYYPNMRIEYDIGDSKYLPDVVSLPSCEGGLPLFWGESGRISTAKAMDLCQRYPDTHIVHCRWGITIDQLVQDEAAAVTKAATAMMQETGRKRTARYTLATIPELDLWRYVDSDGTVHITMDEVEWKDVEF